MGATAKWLEFAVLYFGLFFCGVLTGIFLLFYDRYEVPPERETDMETLKLFNAYKTDNIGIMEGELLPDSTGSSF